MKHANNGTCAKCQEIINTYPHFHAELLAWFIEFQSRRPEAHISEAGRGRALQEIFFRRGSSKAQYGESAHNYNAAFDLFENGGDRKNIYEKSWFTEVLSKELPDWIEWYGKRGSKFYELPHVEVKEWKKLVASGQLQLVEAKNNDGGPIP